LRSILQSFNKKINTGIVFDAEDGFDVMKQPTVNIIFTYFLKDSFVNDSWSDKQYWRINKKDLKECWKDYS